MKRFIIACMAASLGVAMQAQSLAILSGKIDNYKGQDTLYCYNPAKAGDMGYDTLSIDKKGSFNYSASIKEPTNIIMFWAGRGSEGDAAEIMLEPDKKINLNVGFQGESPKTKMQITFKGKNTSKQDFTNQFYQHFSRRQEFSDDIASGYHSFFAYSQYVDATLNDMQTSISKMDDISFAQKAQNSVDNYKQKIYFDYAVQQEKTGRKMAEDSDFMKIVNAIDRNDTNQVNSIIYYLDWQAAADPDKYKPLTGSAANMARLRDYTQNQDVRDKVADSNLQSVFFLMMYGMSASDPSLKDVYEQYLLTGSKPEFRDFCDKQLKAMSNTAVGSSPVDFALADVSDREFSFAGLIKEGVVTYFDFWATWCGPCKREIPHLARLVEEYKGNDKVRIISISIDADKDAWKKMITADRPLWEQYIVPDLEHCDGLIKYDITSIPRFMLFGTDGKLVSSSATRPSNPATKEKIEELLAR